MSKPIKKEFWVSPKSRAINYRDTYDWHKKFVILPVTLNTGERVWVTYVERKGVASGWATLVCGDHWENWEYREVRDD